MVVADLAGIKGICAPAAGKIEVAEIKLCDRAATLADEERARTIVAAEACANPTKWNDLIIP